MSDRAAKRELIKKDLLALLVSSPVELTVPELKNDYHTFIGRPLDYRGIGFTTLEDFLRDIEDAVQIGWKNGMMTLKAKPDETTVHIQALVSKQRVTNKKKYAVYRNRGGGGRSYSNYNRSGQMRNNSYNSYNWPRERPQLPPPLIPFNIRSQIKELFRCFPEGIVLSNFEQAFSMKYGVKIDFKRYGYHNIHEFLKALKDLVEVKQASNGEWRIVAVGLPSNSVKERKPSGVNTSPDSEKTRPSKGRGKRREPSGGSEGAASTGSRGSRRSTEPADQLETEIQQVLEKFSEGIWAAAFPVEYEQMHKKGLRFKDYGYLSVVELMSNFPHIVTIRRPNRRGDWMLYDKRTAPPEPSEEEPARSRSRQMSGHIVDHEMRAAICSILAHRQSGIPIRQFPQMYKEYTGVDLPVKELGFESPDNLFLSLADSLLQIAYTNEELTLFSIDADIASLESSSCHSSEHTIQPSVGQDQLPDTVPPDAVGPGCHYVPVMLPDNQEYVELYVSNISHPGLFWVFLRHKTKSLALEELMDQLEYAYRHVGEEYKMPVKLMVRGQVCACLFPEDSNWHRGVITGKKDSGFAEIYYVDYGNTNFVAMNTIRFLKHEFLRLPAQAIQCRLAHLQPTGTKWKTKCRLRFIELTRDRPLIASVSDVRNQVMSLVLIDTNDPHVDKHINDTLVYEGLAMFKPDEDTPGLLDQRLEEAPDYSNVFGWNHNEVPRLPKTAHSQLANSSTVTGSSDVTQTDSEKQPYSYIRWVQLTQHHIVHVINLEEVAYIVSAEISSFFWDDDILTVMVRKKGLDIEKRLVCCDEYEELFNQLAQYKTPSPQKDLPGSQRFLTLYKLQCIPAILEAFECEDEALITAISELIEKFDPYSPYWKCQKTEDGNDQQPIANGLPSEETVVKGDNSEEMEEVEDEGYLPSLTLEQTQMALQTLQLKRKRILQKLLSDPSCMAETVNQLHDCEIEISNLKEEIEHLQLQGSKSSIGSSKSETSSQPTVLDNRPQQQASLPVSNPSSAELPNSIDNVANQSSGEHVQNQSTAGSLPGLMGNMPFAQQQPMMNPLLIGQNGVPVNGMGDMSHMTNMMSAANFGLLPGLIPTMPLGVMTTAGLPMNMNPFLMSQPLMQTTMNNNPMLVAPLTAHMNQMNLNTKPGTMPALGRGQGLNPTGVGILPGLLPLVQNLQQKNIGRGNFNNS